MIACLALLVSANLEVGDGKPFTRIEAAIAAAQPGDTISVYPSDGYGKTAVRVQVPKLTIRAVGRVVIDGTGFDYSGVGRVPRAIFQIDAPGVSVVGFDLKGAHNQSFNGAGVRINGASDVTIRNCEIHDCDMGIMSGGRDQVADAAANQTYDHCDVHGNGSLSDPGYNHNFYLGGTSAHLMDCRIWGSLTGHNLKSRCHFLLAERCWIHGAANREIDLVDAWDTERPHSNAVFIDCRVDKDPNAQGNRGVIQFGAEKGRRDGCLYLIDCKITTPFASPVVALTSAQARAELEDCTVTNPIRSATLISATVPAALSNSIVRHCVLSPCYSVQQQASSTNSKSYEDGEGHRVTLPPGHV